MYSPTAKRPPQAERGEGKVTVPSTKKDILEREGLNSATAFSKSGAPSVLKHAVGNDRLHYGTLRPSSHSLQGVGKVAPSSVRKDALESERLRSIAPFRTPVTENPTENANSQLSPAAMALRTNSVQPARTRSSPSPYRTLSPPGTDVHHKGHLIEKVTLESNFQPRGGENVGFRVL